jgi:hypothetical protein
VARGHQADIVETGEFPFGGYDIAGLELAGFNDAADRTLNAAIRGDAVRSFGEHFKSSTAQQGHTSAKCGTVKDETNAKWSGGGADHGREVNGFSRAAKTLNACNTRTDDS